MYKFLFFFMGFCCLILTGCSEEENFEENFNGFMKVNVVEVKSSIWNKTLSLSGIVVAKDEVEVKTSLSGLLVDDVKNEIGDYVTAGQVLATLENVNVQSLLSRNEAALKRAKSNLEAQKAILKEAENNYRRYVSIEQSGAVSKSALDQHLLKVEIARSSVNASLAEIAELEAQLNDSIQQRSKAQVIAPVSGIIIARGISKGTLTDNNTLFTIAQDGVLEVMVEVNRDELVDIVEGLDVEVEFNKQEVILGKVRLVSPEINKLTHLSKVYISLNTKTSFRIGSNCSVTISLAKKNVNLSVPFSAVNFENNGTTSVKIVNKEGQVTQRKVIIGEIYNGYVEILSGTETGELIVLQASAFIDDGDLIDPILVGDAE